MAKSPCRRAAKRRLQCIWQAWQQAAQHRAHVRHYLATSILRICHKSTGTAFSQWKEYVEASIALRDQQEQAVSHMLSVRLHHALIAWRRQIRHRQQLQVCLSPVLGHACRAQAHTTGFKLQVYIHFTTVRYFACSCRQAVSAKLR